jgi:hypothetical protein
MLVFIDLLQIGKYHLMVLLHGNVQTMDKQVILAVTLILLIIIQYYEIPVIAVLVIKLLITRINCYNIVFAKIDEQHLNLILQMIDENELVVYNHVKH